MELYITGMVNKLIKEFSIKDIKFVFDCKTKNGVSIAKNPKTTTASASFSASIINIKNQVFDTTINNFSLKHESIPETFADAKILIKFAVKKTEKSIPTTAEEYLADLIIPSDQIVLKRNDQYYALPVTKMLYIRAFFCK